MRIRWPWLLLGTLLLSACDDQKPPADGFAGDRKSVV